MRAEGQAHIARIEAALALVRKFLDWERALRRLDELNAHDAATLLHQRLDTAAACDVASQHELGGFGRATGNGHSPSAVANTETSRGPVACT